jgi:hypothetical protein
MYSLIEKFVVKKLLQLGYTVTELSFESFQKLLGGGGVSPCSSQCPPMLLSSSFILCDMLHPDFYVRKMYRYFSIPIFNKRILSECSLLHACVVNYSIYFLLMENILSFQMKTYNQQILKHRQDESNTSFIKVRENEKGCQRFLIVSY